jgi:hypothetical protein
MGFWDDLTKAVEDSLKDVNEAVGDARKKKQEELKQNLAGLGAQTSKSTREREIDRLVSDPNALNGFSLQELEHQRLTAQSELERIQDAIRKQQAKVDELAKVEYPLLANRVKQSFANAQAEENKNQARKRTLLINLIEVRKKALKETPPVPPAPASLPSVDPEEFRARKKAEIMAKLAGLAAEEQKMAETTDDEDMKHQIANMYANRRSDLIDELREWI